jgi:hypothetical protein
LGKRASESAETGTKTAGGLRLGGMMNEADDG